DFDIEELQSLIEILEKTHTNFVISKEYENLDDDVYLEEKEEIIENSIMLSRELYFHIQSIMFLEKKLFLSKYNYNNIKEIYPEDELNWEIDDVKSPVFNYHLSKVLTRYSKLNYLLKKIGIE
ncbi:MAG: hypothetical protein ACRDD7_00885, partial [Peptostreptococcaceae bacterium]